MFKKIIITNLTEQPENLSFNFFQTCLVFLLLFFVLTLIYLILERFWLPIVRQRAEYCKIDQLKPPHLFFCNCHQRMFLNNIFKSLSCCDEAACFCLPLTNENRCLEF